jgi:hypothetical protein
MTERALFFNALARTDPAQRAAYLDTACAGDPALRARIEALLRSSDAAGDFLDTPAVEQLAAYAGDRATEKEQPTSQDGSSCTVDQADPERADDPVQHGSHGADRSCGETNRPS